MNRKLVIAVISTAVVAAAAALFFYQRSVLHTYQELVRDGITLEGTVTGIAPRAPTRYYEGHTKPFEVQIAYTDPFGFFRRINETIYFDAATLKLKKQDTVTVYFLHRDGNTRAVSAYNPFIKKLIPPKH